MTATSMVTVDRCSPPDCQAVAALARKIWQEWANGMPLSRQLIDLGHPVFVAKTTDGTVIAYAVGIKEAFGPGGWILSVSVDEGYRRQGIGNKLLAAVLDVFRGNGVTWIGAIISEKNHASQTLFQSFGFIKKATMDDYYPPDIVHRFELVWI
jgi:L-amino acid N-acyltransferase YncA